MLPRMAQAQAKCKGSLYPPIAKQNEDMRGQAMGSLPPSYFIIGMRATPANTTGIPMTRPENVGVPPRCCAYSLDEETTMKKVT